MRSKPKIEPRLVLKFQSALSTVAFSAHHDEWGYEADHFKVLAQFFGVPDLPVLGFKGFTAAGLGIDFDDTLTAGGFGGVRRGDLLGLVARRMYN